LDIKEQLSLCRGVRLPSFEESGNQKKIMKNNTHTYNTYIHVYMRQDRVPAHIQYIHGDYSAPNLLGAFDTRPHRVVYSELVSILDIPIVIGVADIVVTDVGIATDSVDSEFSTFISSAVFKSNNLLVRLSG